jgi:hypothetical protein
MIAVSSTGGATVYALVNGLSTDFVVCDTKAEGHHAFGEVQIQLSDGSWQTEGSANEYSGNGFCTDSVAVTFVGPDYRAVAETKEGDTVIGSPGYSKVFVAQ